MGNAMQIEFICKNEVKTWKVKRWSTCCTSYDWTNVWNVNRRTEQKTITVSCKDIKNIVVSTGLGLKSFLSTLLVADVYDFVVCNNSFICIINTWYLLVVQQGGIASVDTKFLSLHEITVTFFLSFFFFCGFSWLNHGHCNKHQQTNQHRWNTTRKQN